MHKDIHIVLSSSNEFIEHCATTIASILYNINKAYNVHFYIFSYDVTERNKKKLSKLSKIHPCSIEYPQFDEKLLDMFDGINLPLHVTKMTYARILIPTILPKVNKAIFIDSDTIVREDISKLYEIDLKDKYFAMVEDANWKQLAIRLWGDASHYYFNAGVMLVNAKKLRKDNYINKIKSQIRLNKNRYQICDQDVINDTFRGQIYRLNLTWNCYHEVFIRRFNCYPVEDMNSFKKICDNPNIVHYVGPEKPWLASIEHKFKKDYYFYNKLTPFYHYVEWQSYQIKLFHETTKAFLLGGKRVYMKVNKNGATQSYLFGQHVHIKFNVKNLLNQMAHLIISKKYDNDNWDIRLLGFPIFSKKAKGTKFKRYSFLKIFSIEKKDTPEKQYIKICEIPIYYNVDNSLRLFEAQKNLLQQITIMQQKIDTLSNLNNYMNKKIANLKCVIEAQKLHEKTFGPYKNAFAGKDVVLVCTGPTAKEYKPIKGAIHVGVNGAIYLDNVKLDFLFIQDYAIRQGHNQTLNLDCDNYVGNNCKKFYGIIPDEHLQTDHCYFVDRIPYKCTYKKNISQYILEEMLTHNFAQDLSREPVGNFLGTPFSALQFILYGNPKRIYLVGRDCGSGYAYSDKKGFNPANYQIEIVVKYVIPFLKRNYPELEIISINPVGLKGLFKDYYTSEDTENA